MKATTTARPIKNPINLAKSPVHFTPTGSIEPVVQRGPAHPGVEGIHAACCISLRGAARSAGNAGNTQT